ncbi:hypothetical protein OQA88_8779 [Cercophora sp. LCS_1]
MGSSKTPGFAMPAPRRVFTAPIQPAGQQDASSSKSLDSSVDTLYDHPSVKIVSFTAGPRTFSIGPRSSLGGHDIEPGTLSWSSQLERTIAVGPFRIYRAPGSVAFLSCGSALQPILPKSQVWCVDEASSKFVLQIRRPQYWRIELPVASPEDVQRAQLLREVFGRILQFEKTECPFKRTFVVELPERPLTPAIKRPWTPVQGSGPALPPTPVTPVDVARIWKGPQGGSASSGIPNSQTELEDFVDTAPQPVSTADEDKALPTSDGIETPTETNKQIGQDASPVAETAQRPLQPAASQPARDHTNRCVTAPPQLMLNQSGFKQTTVGDVTETIGEEQTPQSPTGSSDSFHSPQSFRSNPLPPSPPRSKPTSPRYPEEKQRSSESGPELVAESLPPLQDFEDVSDITTQPSPGRSSSPISETSESATAPSSICDLDCPSPSPTPIPDDATIPTSVSSSSLSSNSTATSTSVPRRIRHRATTSSSISPSRRALSPLPSAANLFTPRPVFGGRNVSPMDLVKRLPMAVISKTCEILMSPPSHLISLMLKVAARIAAGEWRGFMFGTGEGGEKIEVGWDLEESDEEDARRLNRGWKRRGSDWGTLKMAGSFPESDDEEEDEEPQGDWSGSLGVD